VLDFQDATGYMVGQEGDGLACMFTMMNSARLAVGLEGVSISERSYQHALAYAIDRVQGRVPGKDGSVAIVEHPDVRRMLFTMKADIEAMRALAYVAIAHLDQSKKNPDTGERAAHQARVDLLTPIVKGWITEHSQVLTSIGVQVHGGMGYVEETGAAQYMRDARILTIYEGTTGIQAGDLIGRKILREQAATLLVLLDDIEATAGELSGDIADIGASLNAAVAEVRGALDWLLKNFSADPSVPGGVSYHFLMMLGVLCGGWQMARAAKVAADKLASDAGDKEFYGAKILSARFYAEQTLPRVTSHALSVKTGSATMMAITLDQLRGD
jgi:hypothetical protein